MHKKCPPKCPKPHTRTPHPPAFSLASLPVLPASFCPPPVKQTDEATHFPWLAHAGPCARRGGRHMRRRLAGRISLMTDASPHDIDQQGYWPVLKRVVRDILPGLLQRDTRGGWRTPRCMGREPGRQLGGKWVRGGGGWNAGIQSWRLGIRVLFWYRATPIQQRYAPEQ